MKTFNQFMAETSMTREQIITAQTGLRKEMDALKREESDLGWSDAELHRRQEIADKLKSLNAEFKVLGSQRVAH